MQSEIWTEFHYLYRDAGNFKVFGRVVLRGRLNENARAAIVETMDADGRFVAEQVDLPALYAPLQQHTNGPSTVDVCTHEFSHFEEVKLGDSPTDHWIWGSAQELAAAFASIDEWEMAMSPNSTQVLASAYG